MIVKLATMTAQEINELLHEQLLCRIAFKDAEYPYIAPFQYVYLKDTLYFHFTDYGKKMRLLQQDNRVCVEIEKIQPDMSDYTFVSLRGRLKMVDDPVERRGGLPSPQRNHFSYSNLKSWRKSASSPPDALKST
jgi:nitroimidazol reductase NimA-like FMN-containing flavoprotein (pyridoxamine 5'-phosphate oxidase superfamily)